MQSYSTKTVIGPDGRPIVEKKVHNEQSTIGRDGRRIVEKQEVYKNSDQNIKRVTKERALDNKTVKVTREVKNDERNEYRELNNLHEDEFDDFNEQWASHARQNNFGKLGIIGGIKEKKRSDDPRGQIRMIKYD